MSFHRVGALLVLLAAPLAWAAAQESASTAAVAPASNRPTTVLLTVSGGVSKGAHQGGVSWALLRLLRRSEDSAFRAQHFLPPQGLRLGGMTGTSAGNINAVLTAFEWCRATDQPDPQASLYWRVWMPTGFTDMLGAHNIHAGTSTDGGLFDRAFFRNTHLRLLQEFASGTEVPLRECGVPIGITMTRRVADSTNLLGGLQVPITRFATTFEVTSAPDRSRLRFVPFAADTQLAHFGPRIWPTERDATGSYSVETIFELVTASSAFPIAFAPQLIHYTRRPDCLGGEGRGACMPDSAYFIDGAVFDNDPLDLTIGIRRRVVTNGPSLTVYIDPDQLRGGELAPRAVPPRLRFGTSGVLQTMGEIVKAGMAAELYSLAKAVDLDPAAFDIPSNPLVISTRHFEISGTEFSDFGAFLGRPLRAFDFMIGVYDGLVSSAKQAEEFRRGDTAVAGRVLADRVWALIEDTTLIAYAPDRHLLRQMWAAEFNRPLPDGAVPGRPRVTEHHAFREGLMDALLAGSVAATRRDPRPECVHMGPLGTMYCKGTLPYFVDAVTTRGAFRDSIAHFANERAAAERRAARSSGRIPPPAPPDFIDEDFARFIDAPQQRLYVLANRLIARQYANERALGSGWASATSVAGMFLNQAYVGEPRSFFGSRDLWGHFDPSTVPSNVNRRTCLRCWVPYRIITFPLMSGVEAEYRPTLRLPKRIGLFATVAPFVWHNPDVTPAIDPDFSPTGRAPERTYWSAGAGVVWQRGLPMFTAGELGWRAYRPYRLGTATLGRGYVHALDVSTQLLAGRFQMGVRIFPDNVGRADERSVRHWGGPTTLNGGYPVTVYAAMPDLPGLLYWFLPH